MTRLAVRSDADELMDAPDLDPAIYAAVMRDLAKVNRVTLARRPTLGFLERAVGKRTAFSLLDVGFGDGDMLRAIARWAKARGIEARLTGIDLNPSSAPAARAHTPHGMTIDWRTGDYAGLANGGFDVIVSSLVAFLRFMEGEAAVGWFVNDLHRHRVAALGYPLLAALMRWHRIVRHDGALSIARSYRPREWPPILAEAGVTDARVVTTFPFRLCVDRRR